MLQPLRQAKNDQKLVVSQEVINTLFGNVEEVFSLSSTLLEKFNECYNTNSRTLADVLTEMEPSLERVYKEYVFNFNASSSLLTRLMDQENSLLENAQLQDVADSDGF